MAHLVGTARRTARRHMRRLGALIGLVVAVVIVANNLTFQVIRSPAYVADAQMIYGWARLYKPMIYDDVRPDAVSFGNSWVRDMFDPVRMEALTGKTFFNFGMSGATSFESLRLVQNMLAVHRPEAVFLDIESFYDTPRAHLVEHQFDERILYVNRDGSPNGRAALNRVVKINTSGAALAFNFRFVETLRALRIGASREDVLPSYQRRDWREFSSTSDEMRRWMETRRPFGEGEVARWRIAPSFDDLEAAIGLLCEAGIEIRLYEAPYICGGDMRQTHLVLALVRKLAPYCASKISFHVFQYPNAVTMEGLARDPGPSLFYRPDGHPRPTLGDMMATRILGLEQAAGAPPMPTDFGADLAAMDDASARDWIMTRAKRCFGQWEPGAYAATLAEMEALRPAWQALYGAKALANP